MWNHKRPQIAKVIFKRTKLEVSVFSDFKLYHRVIVFKTVCYWNKNRYIDQWNRIERPEINPHTYGQLIYNRENKNIQSGKDSLFNKQFWKNWTVTCKRMNLDHYLIPYMTIKLKWIKNWNVRSETIKLLEESIGGQLFDFDLNDTFMDPSPQARTTKAKINKWDYIKLKCFCTVKESCNKMER